MRCCLKNIAAPPQASSEGYGGAVRFMNGSGLAATKKAKNGAVCKEERLYVDKLDTLEDKIYSKVEMHPSAAVGDCGCAGGFAGKISGWRFEKRG